MMLEILDWNEYIGMYGHVHSRNSMSEATIKLVNNSLTLGLTSSNGHLIDLSDTVRLKRLLTSENIPHIFKKARYVDTPWTIRTETLDERIMCGWLCICEDESSSNDINMSISIPLEKDVVLRVFSLVAEYNALLLERGMRPLIRNKELRDFKKKGVAYIDGDYNNPTGPTNAIIKSFFK